MNIIVLVKQVPEMERVKFDTERGVINRKSAGVEVNPFDLNALEAAVEIKEKVGGKITAISMGPSRAENALKEAISRGADEGILLTDRSFAGADTIATSRVLSDAIKKIKNFDLIIAGEMTVDGDTAQVGPQTAEYLNIPHIAYVNKILESDDNSLEVMTTIWNASYKKKISFPGLITVTKDVNVPRLPSLRDKMKARKAEITKWGFEEINSTYSKDEMGIKGSPTKVKNIDIPTPSKREGKVWRGEDITEALDKIYEICIDKNVIGG